MSVILLILKIIGILLLAVIGLILLIAGLVLFVPIHYQIQGDLQESICIRGKFHWLLHLFVLNFAYEEKRFTYYLRILGIRKDFKNRDVKEEPDEEEQVHHSPECEIPHKIKDSNLDVEPLKEEPKQEMLDEDSLENPTNKNNSRTNIFKRFFRKIKELWYHTVELLSLVKQIPDHISDIKRAILDETNKKTVFLLIKELRRLLRHFKFRHIKGELTFSMADPAMTGQVLGILSMFPILYRYDANIYPDFESDELYVRGSLCVKGRIRALQLIATALRLWKEKDFRVLLHRLLKNK